MIDATGSHHDLLVVYLGVVHIATVELLGEGRFALVSNLRLLKYFRIEIVLNKN